jgi:hypothetical protein
MATTLQFDTLDYAKKLKMAGVPTEQAEAQATALGDALAQSVAFPSDLVTLEKNLSTKIETSESRLESKIEAVKLELTGKIDTLKWMFGVLVALNGGILIRLLVVQ